MANNLFFCSTTLGAFLALTRLTLFSYHVLQVNERVIDGHHLNAFLKASPQDQTANTTEAMSGRQKD